MRSFSALVEVGSDGWATVWVAELLGLFVNEPSEQQALDQLPDAITAYLRWARRHGDDVEVPERVAYTVGERQVLPWDLAHGEYATLFARDREPVTDEEIARATRWMRYMRHDTLDLVARLPEGAMEWRRTPDHPYTIGGYLEHVARAERGYLARVWDDVPAHVPGPTPLLSLASARERALNWLQTMPAEIRSRVTEEWSARKALGRYLYHERYHIRSIARIALERGVSVPEGLGGWHAYGTATP